MLKDFPKESQVYFAPSPKVAVLQLSSSHLFRQQPSLDLHSKHGLLGPYPALLCPFTELVPGLVG